MRCHICDKLLNEKEIQYEKRDKTFEPCGECLEIALDAAYSDGFSPDNDIDHDYTGPGVETLEPDVNISVFSLSDIIIERGPGDD